jgi:hypothetical protein
MNLFKAERSSSNALATVPARAGSKLVAAGLTNSINVSLTFH